MSVCNVVTDVFLVVKMIQRSVSPAKMQLIFINNNVYKIAQ